MATKPILDELDMEYAGALEDYVARGGEAALEQAYEVGRRALSEKLAILDMVAIHHRDGKLRSEEHTLNSSHLGISYAVFCLKKKKKKCLRSLDSTVATGRATRGTGPHAARRARALTQI